MNLVARARHEPLERCLRGSGRHRHWRFGSAHGLTGPARLLAICLMALPPAFAVDRVELSLGRIDGAGWQADKLTLQLAWTSPPLAELRVDIDRLQLAAVPDPLTAVQLVCTRAVVTDSRIRCEDGRLRARGTPLAAQAVPVNFDYQHRDRRLELRVGEAAVAGGHITLRARLLAGRWEAGMTLRGVQAEPLAALLARYLAWPAGLTVAGTIGANIELAGAGSDPGRLAISADIERLGFFAADGVNAGENLNLRLQAGSRRQSGRWHLDAALAAHGGTLCLRTCWELPEPSLTLTGKGHWQPAAGELAMTELEFQHPDVTRASGQLRLALDDQVRLESASLRLAPSTLSGLYRTWLQPLAVGTLLGQLDTTGTVQAELEYGRTGPRSAHIVLQDVHADDRAGRFGVYGLNGDLAWSSNADTPPSQLSWAGGHVYRVPLGQADVLVQAGGEAARLLRPLALPLLDGVLRVDSFGLEHPATPDMKWAFDGTLTPVSMASVTHALGWPSMSGTLSGVIPDVTYDKGVLRVGGVLLVRAFDGNVTVSGLRIERLFGVAPSLQADVDVSNLDLDALTRTFSFGKIEGRLSGRIGQLRLHDWQPMAFDASFATPEDDRSRHRISQKAVDNLTSLGGGSIGGALSRSFLRVFEQFSYDRLGISCRLRAGVCEMDGVAPAPSGYYLVTGGGLPRIDVIGYARRVDWDTLVERLARVTTGASPTVR